AVPRQRFPVPYRYAPPFFPPIARKSSVALRNARSPVPPLPSVRRTVAVPPGHQAAVRRVDQVSAGGGVAGTSAALVTKAVPSGAGRWGRTWRVLAFCAVCVSARGV